MNEPAYVLVFLLKPSITNLVLTYLVECFTRERERLRNSFLAIAKRKQSNTGQRRELRKMMSALELEILCNMQNTKQNSHARQADFSFFYVDTVLKAKPAHQ